MKRREFISLLGSGVMAWPLAGRAQQPAKETAIPIVGLLGLTSPEAFAEEVAAFHQGLNELGYIEGRNVTIDYRWAQGHFDQLPALAADLVHEPLSVLVATGTPASAFAAKAVTETIPNLPIQQSVKVDLILNMRTAKALGLAIPIPLLGRVDEAMD